MVPQRAQLVETDTLTQQGSALRTIGDTVALRSLAALASGDLRFSALHAAVGGSTKTVVARLKALESDGLVTRTLYAEVPPRAVYSLTSKGRELLAIASRIAGWERSWRQSG